MEDHTCHEGPLSTGVKTAAILARGLGSRMQRADAAASASAAQDNVASTGLKGMIPIERPFLEYVISALADAGVIDVVLVIGPEHDSIRRHFTEEVHPERVSIRFAVQEKPLGTANAVRAAADVIGAEPFIVLNADNYYPVGALRALTAARDAAAVAFDRDALTRLGNIDADRVRSYAIMDIDYDDNLVAIIEKPGDSIDPGSERARWVGMNCWTVTAAIVDACWRVPLSRRGEYELPEAVALAIGEGTRVRVVRFEGGVLDLSQRSDIAAVTKALKGVVPRL